MRDVQPTNGSWQENLNFSEGLYTYVAMVQDDGTWKAASNYITIHMMRKIIPAPVVTTDIQGETVEKGTLVRITISEDPVELPGEESAPAINYSGTLYRVERSDESYLGPRMMNSRRQFVIPTDNLIAEKSYRFRIYNYFAGWEGNCTAVFFRVTEAATPAANFRVSSTRIMTGETVEIFYYAADATRTGIVIEKDGEGYPSLTTDQEIGYWEYTANGGAGTYTFTPFAMIGGSQMDVEPVKIIVLDAEWTDYLQLPTDITRIEANAFEGGAFQAVVIPDRCTEIGAGAFANCTKLRYVQYPVKCLIGESAFAGCGEGLILDPR